MTRTQIRLGALVALAIVISVAASGRSSSDALIIRRLILVESRAYGRHFVEEVYRAEIQHTGAPGGVDFARVTSRLTFPFTLPAPGILEVVDGELVFGTIRPGQVVESLDTLTVRRLRYPPFASKHLRWTISARPDFVLTDAWAGLWEFTITSRNADTNAIVSVVRVTDTIGPREPVGFSLLPGFVQCSWSGGDESIEGRCAARVTLNACLTEGSSEFNVEREGANLKGRGEWRASATGECGDFSGAEHGSMELIATRIADEAAPEPTSAGLFPVLIRHPALIPLLAAGNVESGQAGGHD